MSLTQCPDCRRLTFINASSCPSCERSFETGVLQAKADAEERAFKRKYGALFLAVLVILLGGLLVVMIGGYTKGTNTFRIQSTAERSLDA